MELDLENVTLSHGAHSKPEQGHCLLEVVSLFAGESFGDSPVCVDPVLAAFGRRWNDGMRSDEERAQLKQYITRLPGTAKGPELSQKRAWLAMDWLIRVHTATWLALTPGLAQHAESLKSLPAITCTADLAVAQPKLDAARAAARDAARAAAEAAAEATARDAAEAAARDAARAAAGDAAEAAAGAAAWAAAGAAARDAAEAAAGAAAWAAAKAKLEPTVVELQASAHQLFSAMIDISES